MVAKNRNILILAGGTAIGIAAATALIFNELKKNESPGPGPTPGPGPNPDPNPQPDPGPGPGPGPTPQPTPEIQIYNITVNPTIGVKPLSVGIGIDVNKVPSKVTYDFGDGTVQQGSLFKTHTYFSAGVFNGTVTVEDDSGNTDSVPFLVQVTPVSDPGDNTTGSIISNFYQEDAIIQQYQFATFSIALAEPFSNIKEIRWNWGDGTPDLVGKSNEILSVDHQYTKSGIFNGKLTAKLIDGTTDERNFTTTVNGDPLDQLDLKITIGDFFGLDINVNESFAAQGVISFGKQPFSSISWDFGDGTKKVGNYVTHIYEQTGTYTIKANVSDANGNTAYAEKTVTVKPQALAVGDLKFVAAPGFSGPAPIKFLPYGGNPYLIEVDLEALVKNFRTDIPVTVFVKVSILRGDGTSFSVTSNGKTIQPGQTATISKSIGVINVSDGPFTIIADLNAADPFLAADMDTFGTSF